MKKQVDLLYRDESYKIRGACFKVYDALGGGIQEKVIERALLKELLAKELEVKTQVRIDIFYQGEKIGTYIPDLVVNDKIVIEVKSKPALTKEDEKQFWGYLKNSEYKLGFLVNFSPAELIIKRFIHTNKVSV